MSDSHINQKGIVAHLSSEAKIGVLAFHGRGSGPESMESLITELGWENQAYALPRAANNTWYPEKFIAPLENNREQLDLALKSAQRHHKMLNDAGIPDEKIIIMGFSQGACLASQYALMNPAKFKAVAVLTGGFVGHPGMNWGFEGDFQQTPVFITTSENDEWVPPFRADETAEEFRRLNADVNYLLFKDRPHSISDQEKEILKGMISL